MLKSPRLAALARNFPAAALAPSLTRGRTHDSPCSSLSRSPPSIHAPLTVHCFKSSLQEEKTLCLGTHSVWRSRGATKAPHKGRCRIQGPSGAPGREPQAAGGRARTSASRQSSGRTARRGHEQGSPRLRRRAPHSSSKKKKKKNQCFRRPLLVAAVKGGQKLQPPPITRLGHPPAPAPPAHPFIRCTNKWS